VRDVELDVELSELDRGDIDMEKVREVFSKLEFRTLLQRVGKLAGVDAEALAEAGTTNVLEQVMPPVKVLLDEELGDWLQKADCPAIVIEAGPQAPATFDVGIATADSLVSLQWQPGGRDYESFEKWLASDAPKICWDAKQQINVVASAGLELGGVRG